MNKFWKIFISIILALVVIAGVYVGIVTKGFRKWENLKTKKENITNLYYNGKTGIAQTEYNDLQESYTNLENENKWLRNKFMNVDYNVSYMDSCSAISIDGGNNSEICYVYNKVGNYGFLNSFKIKNIKKLFESGMSVFEVRFFDLYNVYEKKDNSFLTEFRIEDKDKRITNDFINSVTFGIGYTEEITSEQKALIEAGTNEDVKFNYTLISDYNLNKENNHYNINVVLCITSVGTEI